jgi:hypothetical protein
MPTKTKTTATKPAPKKSAAKIPPLRFAGVPASGLMAAQLHLLLNLRTSKELAGLLRERGLGIPKDKPEMVARLISWCQRSQGLFTLTLS